MKNIKKLMAIALVAMMFAVMTVPAMAEDASITITNALNGATYNAYRLLNTTVSLHNPGCHATEAEHLSTCYTISYTLNPQYKKALEDVTGKSGHEIIEYIGALDSSSIITFSEAVYEKVKSMEPDATVKSSGETATLNAVGSGYWLIVETGITDVAISRIMLDTSGSRDVSISTSPKRQQPTLEKSVGDNGLNHGAGADVAIGDDVEFLLTAYIPDPTGYSNYTYTIHDTMEKGLSFVEGSGEASINGYNAEAKLDPKYFTVSTGTDANGNTTITTTIDIMAAIAAGDLQPTNRLFITYDAVLNENCDVLVDGTHTDNANFNKAYLQYSNIPYDETSTAKTTESTAYVWTFPLTINKVDADGKNLTGAQFVVSKNGRLEISAGDSIDSVKDELIGFTKVGDAYRLSPTGTEYVIDAGSAQLQGFNDQTDYYIYEIKNPDGYKALSAPVHFKFFATYDGSNPTFAAGSPSVSIDSGNPSTVLEANIINRTGTELPSTGGIGTTIFYVLGGLLAAGAVVFLITNKRVDDKR